MKNINTKDRLEVDALTRNKRYFPHQNIIENYREVLTNSIMKNGLREDNKFLNWAVDNKIPINAKMAQLMQQYLQSRKLELDENYCIDFEGKGNNWPVNKKAFTSVYKLQALLFLSDEDQAEDFGDLNYRPFAQVLEATTDKEVAKIVDSWQSREGTGRDVPYGSRRTTEKIQNNVYKDSQEAIADVLKIFKTLKVEFPGLENIIKQKYKKSIPKTTLLGLIMLDLYDKNKPEEKKK